MPEILPPAALRPAVQLRVGRGVLGDETRREGLDVELGQHAPAGARRVGGVHHLRSAGEHRVGDDAFDDAFVLHVKRNLLLPETPTTSSRVRALDFTACDPDRPRGREDH